MQYIKYVSVWTLSLLLSFGAIYNVSAQNHKIKRKEVHKASREDKELALGLIKSLGKPEGYKALSTEVYRSRGEVPAQAQHLAANFTYGEQIRPILGLYRLIKTNDHKSKGMVDRFKKELLPEPLQIAPRNFDGYIAAHKYRANSENGKDSEERCTLFFLDKDLSKVVGVQDWANFDYGYTLAVLDLLPELLKEEISLEQAFAKTADYSPTIPERSKGMSVASFPGGNAARREYLKENMLYPQDLAERRISAKVALQFVVEADGSIRGLSIVSNSLYPSFNLEALRLVLSMPKWEPAKFKGEAIPSIATLIIDFRIE